MKNFAPVWYTIPAFENTVPVSVYHKEQDEEKQAQIRKKQDSVKNLHVLARADFFTHSFGRRKGHSSPHSR